MNYGEVLFRKGWMMNWGLSGDEDELKLISQPNVLCGTWC